MISLADNIPLNDPRQDQIEMAEAAQCLINSDEWKKVIDGVYFEAFAITNAYNAAMFDDAARRRFLEKTISRGHLSKFINDIINDGNEARESLRAEEIDDE